MINQSTNIEEILSRITRGCKEYYIEQPSISSKESLNSLTIYSRFKKFKGEITPILLKQHLSGEINLAIPLKDRDILLFEYNGKDAIAFGALLYKIATKEFDISDIFISSFTDNKLIIYLVCQNSIDIDELADEIDEKLQRFFFKEWKILPNRNLPDLGNLFILPKEVIKLPWRF